MVYTKKTGYKKRPIKKSFKKRGIKKGKYGGTKNLISLIKKVSLKNSETKYNHSITENYNMLHNGGMIVNSLLYCQQGITDTGTGLSSYSNRIGDEVIGRGIQIKLWVANKLDRPNVMYRLIVYKYQAQSAPIASALFKGANPNRIMDDIDREYITPVYQRIFNLQVGYSASAGGTSNTGKEAHKYLSVYIPLKNKKIHYADGGTLPKFFNYGYYLVPYDSYGTLPTDNIASVSHSWKFYFKDP